MGGNANEQPCSYKSFLQALQARYRGYCNFGGWLTDEIMEPRYLGCYNSQGKTQPMNQNVKVTMARENLQDIPEFPLPDGFSIRWYQPGDEMIWVSLQTAADRFNKITPVLFESEFTEPSLLPGRQFYLYDRGGLPTGTATAWFKEMSGQRVGRVHWVAILPENQGRGLGKVLMTICCRRLRELGHERAVLATSSARIPAIRLYRQFGFLPVASDHREQP